MQGTVLLLNEESDATSTTLAKRTKDGSVVLVPQPTDDPNDPLNWTRRRRDFNYLTLLVTSILSLIHGPMLSAVTVDLATEYDKSINEIAQLTSYMLLSIGCFAYIYSILARMYGKRGLFLTSLLILVASDVWGACASEYNSLFGARILSGCGQAMFEALSLSVVSDLFFVHERGKRISLYLFFSQSGVTLGTPIINQVIVKHGLRASFTGLAISEAIMFAVMFFSFYECAYPRDEALTPPAHGQHDIRETTADAEKGDAQTVIEHVNISDASYPNRPATGSSGLEREPHSYVKKLLPFSGKFSSHNIIYLSWRTLALSFHPLIVWAAITGLPLAWPVGISFTLAPLMTAPPYNFSASSVGDMFIAAWVGATLSLLAGATIDKTVMILTRRNRNIFEPEFRLWYVLPAIVLFLIGWTGWGWGAQTGLSWPGLAVMLALIYFGALLINTAIISYILDGYGMYAVESQVILFAVKNFFAFGMGFFFVEWYTERGPKEVFGIISGVVTGFTLLTVVVYIFGKKLRAYYTHSPFLGITQM